MNWLYIFGEFDIFTFKMTTPEGFTTYTEEDIQKNFKFFGPESLFVSSVRVETNPDGSVGNKAIGLWVVTGAVCADHFAKFTTQLKGREEAVDVQLLPGHFGPELLGQTLGVLAAAKHSEQMIEILPSYRAIRGVGYGEPAFPGDQVNLCVQLEEPKFDDKGRLRTINGSGVIVFNEKVVSVADKMVVNINPLELGVKGLSRVRIRHQTDPWIPASFENFPTYFETAARILNT